MPRPATDWTDQKFGNLTAVRNTGKKNCRAFVWEWRCDCGAMHEALPHHVSSGNTKSCGCYKDAKSVIIPGEKYERLTALSKTRTVRFGARLWRFRCDCGNEVLLSASAVLGDQKSCGCLKRETKPNLRHGFCKTSADDAEDRTYRTWQLMNARCRGSGLKSEKHYRARNIIVCDRWSGSFEHFLSDMGLKPNGMTIERIDNNGNYEPGNCRWATQAEQLRNTRRTIRVGVGGREMCLKDACEALGVNYSCARSRMRRGQTVEQALGL